jgi:hypothetical protein
MSVPDYQVVPTAFPQELQPVRRRYGDTHLGKGPMSMHTHTHFEDQERISSAMTELLALGLVAALAFWLVQVPV